MMRKTNLFLCVCALAVGIPTVSGCRQEEYPLGRENPPLESPLRIAADIAAERVLTRADVSPSYDKTAFVAGDVIKVERTNTSSTLTPASCTYKLTDAKTWVWTEDPLETGGPFYTYENGETFTATYPATFDVIKEDQTGDGFLQSNQLTAQAKAANGGVSFNFAPAFTKITVIVYYQTAEAVPTTDVLTLTASALRGGSGDESVRCLCKTNAAATEHTWSAIINPGTYALSISLGNTTYTATSKQYKAATHYIYTLYRQGDRFQMSGNVTIKEYDTNGTTAGSDISAT